MQVDRHVEVLNGGPETVVVGGVERSYPTDVGRHGREEDAAAQPVLLDPRDVFDGVVDVIEKELSDARTLVRLIGTEIGEPAIVGVNAGSTQLVLFGLGRGGKEHEPGGERREGGRGD